MKNKRPINSDVFFVNFIDQVVELTTKTIITDSDETNDRYASYPMVFGGILVDYDEEYYYLSTEIGGPVFQAVDRHNVLHISVKNMDEGDSLLDEFPTPNDKNQIN